MKDENAKSFLCIKSNGSLIKMGGTYTGYLGGLVSDSLYIYPEGHHPWSADWIICSEDDFILDPEGD
jgi:hypothetical protein